MPVFKNGCRTRKTEKKDNYYISFKNKQIKQAFNIETITFDNHVFIFEIYTREKKLILC